MRNSPHTVVSPCVAIMLIAAPPHCLNDFELIGTAAFRRLTQIVGVKMFAFTLKGIEITVCSRFSVVFVLQVMFWGVHREHGGRERSAGIEEAVSLCCLQLCHRSHQLQLQRDQVLPRLPLYREKRKGVPLWRNACYTVPDPGPVDGNI